MKIFSEKKQVVSKKTQKRSTGKGFARRRVSRNQFLLTFAIILGTIFLMTGCKKEIDSTRYGQDNPTIEADTKAYGQVFWPPSGGNCTVGNPAAAPWGAGWSAKQGWHIKVYNQWQLVNAINTVNSSGGVIYIDASFTVTTNLPTITRNNVQILSNNSKTIYDNVVGGSKASAMFNVTGSNFKMKNVTIQGAGRTNPNNFNWSGKRSAIAVSGNNSEFFRVKIQYFSHAAIRLENGYGHTVDRCVLMDQKKSSLGYGVLLRNNARNVTVKTCRFNRNSHSIATTGGPNQSFKAVGNYSDGSYKWHFDAHGTNGVAASKIEIINNKTGGTQSLFVVRGKVTNGTFIRNNKYNRDAGNMVKIKPDQTFSAHGHTYVQGVFYSPFGGSTSDKQKAKSFFQHGEITGNCIWQ
ncbi:MAG: right-handed parallel beta-helix repeat-containing protein [Crocinitomicaceae bacterium]